MSRRSVLHGLGATGVAAGLSGVATAASAAAVPAQDAREDEGRGWDGFDRAVRAEFRRQRLVGAAVAVVSSDRVLYRRPLGVRDTARPRRVTSDTHFLVASTTKSMTSLLAATYVDDGTIGWDQKAIDAWSGFRAPTRALTRRLRVRDLLGMGTGIGEPPALSGFHEGDPTAPQVLDSLVNLPVEAPPETRWIYNNTVYAVGGYLPLLAAGVPEADLAAAYVEAMRDRVFRPLGMRDTRIADDPRGLVDDCSRGHGLDWRGRTTTLPYGPVGSYAPVGGALSTLDDMASYVRFHLRGGRSVTGERVVSRDVLDECWKPHVPVPLDPNLDPDGLRSGYAMGWIREQYPGGTSLVWHNGAIDGFIAYIGFFPERDLGIVVLNSMNPVPIGPFFYTHVLNQLMSRRLGLNEGVASRIRAAETAARNGLLDLGATTRPVDRDRVRRHLGFYEGGYRLVLDGSRLVLRLQSRRISLRWVDGERYVMADGFLVGSPMRLFRDSDGTAAMDVAGAETVRRTVGLDAGD